MSAGLASLVALTGGASTSLAEAIVLAPVADTAIWAQKPDQNYGRFAVVPIGPAYRTNFFGAVLDAPARGLLRFDVAGALPAGAKVTEVTLTVQVSDSSVDPALDSVVLHRTLLDWGEGAQSAGETDVTAEVGEANWGWCKFGQATWSHPGAARGLDYIAVESGWVNVKQPGSYTFGSLPAMVEDIQAWLDRPQFNHGWLLKSRNETVKQGDGPKRLVTREGPADQRPRLVIGFTPPPVAAPRLTGRSLPDGTLELDCRLNPGSRCELRALADLTTTNFTVLTNYLAGPTGLEARFATAPSAAQRYYRLVETGSGN